MKFVSFVNKGDPRITAFRKRVCEESGAAPSYFEQALTANEVRKAHPELPASQIEEIYKFGQKKWSSTEFSRVEGAELDGALFSISGSRRYSPSILRVAMHHYTLKSYRTRCRGLFFRKSGFLERHVEFAENPEALRFVFFSVYPHNSKLKSLVKNMEGRRATHEGLEMRSLKDFRPFPRPLVLHGVQQHLFVYCLKREANWIEDFEREWKSIES